MPEVSLIDDLYCRVMSGLDGMRRQRLPLADHVVVIHPAKWEALRRAYLDVPRVYVDLYQPRLFGIPIIVDPHVDEEYIALRHEVPL